VNTERQYIGFRLDGSDFAVDILKVREIVRGEDPTPVPCADPRVRGVINLRGEVIAVFDPGSGSREAADGHVMVLCHGERTAGLRVDTITGVVRIAEDRIEPVSTPPDASASLPVTRVARVGRDGLVLLPDLGKIFGGVPSRSGGAHAGAGKKEEETEERKEEPMPEPSTHSLPEAKTAVPPAPARGESAPVDAETARRLFQEVQMLMDSLAGGDMDAAEKAVDAIARLSEKKLFDEVGNLTRNLHESLKEFRKALDPKIRSMATQDVPEAADNLEQVIAMTAQAADKTLNVVEEGQAEVAAMKALVQEIRQRARSLRESGADAGEVSALEAAAGAFEGHLDRTLAGYTEIIMSQGFQDLTGQIIRRIIKLVHELEEQLVKLIRNFGVEIQPEPAAEAELKGPVSDTRIDQNDVDELLSSFGF